MLKHFGIKVFNGTDFTQLLSDAVSGYLGQLSGEHIAIHQGIHFFLDKYAQAAASGNVDIVFEVPNLTKLAHFRWQVDAQDSGIAILAYEGIAANADGTALTPLNNKRDSSTTSMMTAVRLNPTGINLTGAIELCNTISGSATTNQNKSKGVLTRDEEWLLKPNTKYLFRVTNLSGSVTNNIAYFFSWYEYIPVN